MIWIFILGVLFLAIISRGFRVLLGILLIIALIAGVWIWHNLKVPGGESDLVRARLELSDLRMDTSGSGYLTGLVRNLDTRMTITSCELQLRLYDCQSQTCPIVGETIARIFLRVPPQHVRDLKYYVTCADVNRRVPDRSWNYQVISVQGLCADGCPAVPEVSVQTDSPMAPYVEPPSGPSQLTPERAEAVWKFPSSEPSNGDNDVSNRWYDLGDGYRGLRLLDEATGRWLAVIDVPDESDPHDSMRQAIFKSLVVDEAAYMTSQEVCHLRLRILSLSSASNCPLRDGGAFDVEFRWDTKGKDMQGRVFLFATR